MVYQVVQRTPHAIRVCRLYRALLKEQANWLGHREQWNEMAVKTRDVFKANKDVPLRQAVALVEDGEAQLKYWKHPNPYIYPHSDGGVCWQRNAPPAYDATMPEAFVEWK